MSNFKVPDSVLIILKQLETAGFQAYLVGGCVRDMIMGRSIHDWDITTDASSDEIMTVFRSTIPTGIKYGTVTVMSRSTKAEVTTFRTDGTYGDMRHPENVRFVKNLEEDLARRDFTMNAMAMDMRGNVTDVFGGRDDIKKGLIRCVGNAEKRFSEDALRMLRAVRFSAQLGFEIEQKTEAAMEKLGRNVAGISAERVLEETVKMLMSPKPEAVLKAFEYGMYSGITDKIPDIAAVGRIGRIKKEKCLKICALAYILGDPEFLPKIKAESKAVKLYKLADSMACDSEKEIRYAVAVYGFGTVGAVSMLRDAKFGGYRFLTMKKIKKSGNYITKNNLQISGEDIIAAGIEKGPQIGAILTALLRHVNDVPEDNNEETLLKLAMSMENM